MSENCNQSCSCLIELFVGNWFEPVAKILEKMEEN